MKEKEQINFFATTNFRGRPVRFGIKLDDRRRHMYLIGKTGMGKSTMLENMVIQDIRNGNGVCYVDPHGDTVEKILDYIPSDRINDVIYFNPTDLDYPIAFNILESVNPLYTHLIANGLVGVFKKIWADSWGPRLEYILMNTILALLQYPGSTLLGVMRMLVDKKFRKKVVDVISDPVVKSFWVDEYANYNEKFRSEAIAPIQNKIGQFLSSTIIRNIVGQPKSSIEMRDIMDNKKILLMNLSKGRIGEENSALLGAMMITRLQIAAMSRVDIPEEDRKDFYLYVDEFQNFATESFADILSEARKYRLNLVMAHQYIEQIEEEVQAAVFGNVGTLVIFRVGAADAEILEPELMPVFEQNDIVNLRKFDVYLKLMIDGVSSNAFSATTLPPLHQPERQREKIVIVSRERYAKPREVVEERILRWSGVEDVHAQTALEENVSAEGGRREERRERLSGDRERPREPSRAPQPERMRFIRVSPSQTHPQQPSPQATPPQEERHQQSQSPAALASLQVQQTPGMEMSGNKKRKRKRRKKKGQDGFPNTPALQPPSQQIEPQRHGLQPKSGMVPAAPALPPERPLPQQPSQAPAQETPRELSPSAPVSPHPKQPPEGLQPGQVIRFD